MWGVVLIRGAPSWLIAAGLAAFPAFAGPDVLNTMAALPQSADVVVVVDRGAQQHASPQGGALERAWRELGDFAGTARAWDELASVLRLTPEEAFDELLGRRCTLILDLDGGSRQWAVLTEVQPAFERRILERLRPAARQTVGNVPILALEHGRFELATSRARLPGRARSPGQPALSTVLIAPAASSELFDSLLPLLQGAPAAEALGGDASFAAARTVGPGDAVVFCRTEPNEFIACSFRIAEEGWTGTVRASPGSVGVSNVARTLWDPPDFDDLGPRAAVAMAGYLPDVTGLALRLAPPQLGPFHDAGESRGVREACVVIVDGSGQAQLTLARQSQDVVTLAPEGDREMANMLGARGGSAPVSETLGAMPGAVRRVRLDSGSIAWAFLPCGTGNAGWWVMHAAPDDAAGAMVRRIGSMLCAADRSPARKAALSAGTVRPSLLLTALEANGVEIAGPLTGLAVMRWFERLSWEAWITPGDVVEGQLTVEMERE